MKVAICSSDGAHVDLHFGKTTDFYIFDFTNGKRRVVDKRKVEKYSPIEAKVLEGTSQHPFNLERFDGILATIRDCKKIFTASIGKVPKQKLEEKGIEVLECKCAIDWIPTGSRCMENLRTKYYLS